MVSVDAPLDRARTTDLWLAPPRAVPHIQHGAEPMTRAAAGSARLDPDSAQWVRALCGTGQEQQDAHERLHALLLRAARAEMSRRAPRTRLAGPEADDLAHQATADAMVGILAKLEHFRGESRFTTWAYKFVILEVSTKVGRHFWRHPTVPMDGEDWDRLPDRFGFAPEDHAQWRATVDALRDAVQRHLTTKQRRVFVALVLQGVPLDALVSDLDTNRNAIYKTMFDARRKLRAALTAEGYLDHDSSRPS